MKAYSTNYIGEMILAKCQKACNDDANCKRFALGKVGSAFEKTCTLYSTETCGYEKGLRFRRIYVPSKLTQNSLIKNFDNDRTITYTSAQDGSYWF